MSNLESNKIFAALLVAGITAMLAGFVAEELVHPHPLAKDAVTIEGAPESAAGAAAGPTGPEPILSMIAAADVAQGEKISKACAACHNFVKGAGAKVGPDLWGVVGRPKGHEDFAYSDGMKTKGGSWTYNDLNHFLWKPKAFVDGTKMNFIGLKKPEDRAAIIAWLRTLNDSPVAPPSDADIKAEQDAAAPKAEVKGGEAAPSTETKAPAAQQSGVPGQDPSAASGSAPATAPVPVAPSGDAAKTPAPSGGGH